MARDKQIADLMSAVEALLFVSDEPVSAARLADILEVGPVQVDEALVALAAEYRDENRGIRYARWREDGASTRIPPTTTSSSATSSHGTRIACRRPLSRPLPSSRITSP